MFPWARSILATRKYGLTPISPTWSQIKLGPIFRKETDKRFYFNLFKKNPEEVNGIRKLIFLSIYSSVAEDYLKGLNAGGHLSTNNIKVIVFTGLRDYFASILKGHAFIYDELLNITRNEHKRGLTFDFQKSISVHIRLGDFKGFRATPIQWYISRLNKLRADVGPGWPIYVFSDGTDEELIPILRLSNARRLTFGSSLADLLALSKSHVLIGSAGSTFGQWASFFGRMPVIWPSGSLTQHLYYENPHLEIECAIEEKTSESFISACKQRIN